MNRLMQLAATGLLLLGLTLEGRAAAKEAPTPTPMDGWLTKAAIWNDGAQSFMDECGPIGFEYESGRDVARSVYPGLSFFTNRVWEAKAFFTAGRVTRIELLLFSRGDTGDLAEEGFERLVKGTTDALTRWAGSKGLALPESLEKGKRHVQGRAWYKPPCRAEMEWAYTAASFTQGSAAPFRSEYLRVRLMPSGTDGGAAAPPASRATPPSAASLKSRVRHSDNGDAWISDIPMVDQGEKGYCAAATAERVLRYFGRPIDQHQVAQIADTARDKGTSLEGIIGALKTIGQPYQLDLRPLQEFDWAEVVNLLKAYNRAAEAKRKP